MEGTDSIYTASWNMKLSPETGDRIDLRIVAEDSNGTVYSAVAARGIVQEENGLLSITEELLTRHFTSSRKVRRHGRGSEI